MWSDPLCAAGEARVLLGDRYELVEELGSGGMATVWRAVDHRLEVQRAVKLLRSHPADAESSIRYRFDQEARLMAKLEHPNIVPVHDVGQQDGQVYLVMSLVAGGSVWDHVKRWGPMPPRQTTRVAIGVLEALVAAHAAGIVHRDIKPQNVLLDLDGTPRLADFGIARVLEQHDLTLSGAVMGTWNYMAPEQRTNTKEAEPRTDLYAVGAMIVALLRGASPRDLHNPESHADQLRGVDRRLRAFVERCTRYAPADRYASAADAVDVLERILTTLPPDPADTTALGSAATPAGPKDPAKEAAKTKPIRWGRIALVLTAVLVLGASVVLVGVAAVGTVVLGQLAAPEPEVPAATEEPPETEVPAAAPAVPEAAPAAPPPAPTPVPAGVAATTPRQTEPPAEEPVPPGPVAPLPVGWVTIGCLPSWCEVHIDDEPFGRTPIVRREVPVGRRKVELVSAGETQMRWVDVDLTEPITFCWDFAADAPCSR